MQISDGEKRGVAGLTMGDDSERNRRIEGLSAMIESDGISPDETDPAILSKYRDAAKTRFGAGDDDDAASKLVDESLLYLKLRSAPDIDPLSDGEKFGVGFS